MNPSIRDIKSPLEQISEHISFEFRYGIELVKNCVKDRKLNAHAARVEARLNDIHDIFLTSTNPNIQEVGVHKLAKLIETEFSKRKEGSLLSPALVRCLEKIYFEDEESRCRLQALREIGSVTPDISLSQPSKENARLPFIKIDDTENDHKALGYAKNLIESYLCSSMQRISDSFTPDKRKEIWALITQSPQYQRWIFGAICQFEQKMFTPQTLEGYPMPISELMSPQGRAKSTAMFLNSKEWENLSTYLAASPDNLVDLAAHLLVRAVMHNQILSREAKAFLRMTGEISGSVDTALCQYEVTDGLRDRLSRLQSGPVEEEQNIQVLEE